MTGKRRDHGKHLWATTLAVCMAGCLAPQGGQVADAWRLVGPFRRDDDTPPARSEPPATMLDTDSLTTNGVQISPDARARDAWTWQDSIDAPDVPPEHHLFGPDRDADDRFWYLDLGFRMGVTRLHETKQQLDRRLDTPRKLDVFGVFDSPQTPIDRKSDFALTTSYIGIGRRETEWLTWNFYFGSGVGGDRDHQRWLTANQEVNFDYALWYTGLTVDIYPWGLSQRGRFRDVTEHLRASRPYLVTGFEVGYLRARGWGSFDIAPIKIYRDSQYIEDWLFSYLLGFGWELPLDDRWALNLQTHYTFHFYRPEEYNGWNVTYALRYQF